MKQKAIFVYITCPSDQEGKKIGKYLLELNLIACANMFPITSIYRWEGKVVDDQECVLIVKTLDSLYDRVREEVEKIHPYAIACIAKISVQCNEKYFGWMYKEVER